MCAETGFSALNRYMERSLCGQFPPHTYPHLHIRRRSYLNDREPFFFPHPHIRRRSLSRLAWTRDHIRRTSTWNGAKSPPSVQRVATGWTAPLVAVHQKSAAATTRWEAAASPTANTRTSVKFKVVVAATQHVSTLCLFFVAPQFPTPPLLNSKSEFASPCIRDILGARETESSQECDRDFLLDGIRDGFQITKEGSQFTPAERTNYRSATETYRELVEDHLYKEPEIGHYIVVHEKPTIVSSLGAVPKPTSGTIQLIHDCSHPLGQGLNSYSTAPPSNSVCGCWNKASVAQWIRVIGPWQALTFLEVSSSTVLTGPCQYLKKRYINYRTCSELGRKRLVTKRDLQG